MPPRELDALLHERLFKFADDFPIMGWKVRGLPKSYCYSTDPAAFFAMVERVREGGWEVVNMCYYRSTKHWYVRLDDAKFRPVTSIGDTLPLAFARAALLTTIPNGGAS